MPPAVAEYKKEEPKAKDLIVGKWHGIDEHKIDTVEFTKDGKIVVKLMKDKEFIEFAGTYKLTSEDKLEIDLTYQGEKYHKETLKVKVAKDELTTTDAQEVVEVLKRVK